MTFIKIMLYQSNAQNALYHNVNKRNGGEEMRGKEWGGGEEYAVQGKYY